MGYKTRTRATAEGNDTIDAEPVFEQIAASLPEAQLGQIFGKRCIKLGRKAFAALFQGDMAFKLPQPAHQQAMELPGSKLWDPSGKGRPMKEWVQVPAAHHPMWHELAGKAYEYIASGE